jgi:subtilisin family serine protease
MDLSRAFIKVNDVQDTQSLPPDMIPYTGKGVVIGMIDGGIDPHHVTFLNSDRTESRVKRFIQTKSSEEASSGELITNIYSTPEEIAAAPADNSCSGHGTHTSSIAAGAWTGNDYKGVAPDADLVLVTMGSELYDDEIAYGMNAVAQYASEKGQPCVMNLSLGSTIGPHDGTATLSQIAYELAQKGVVSCFSSGNDGKRDMSFKRDFSKNPEPISSVFYNYSSNLDKVYYMDAWSNDTTPAQICVHIVHQQQGEIYYTSRYFSASDVDPEKGYITLLDRKKSDGSLLPELAEYLGASTVVLQIGIAPENGKFRIRLECEIPYGQGQDLKGLAFSIKSDEGANMRIYSEGWLCVMMSAGAPGFIDASPDESVSSYCTGDGVIGVGSINIRQSYTNLDGETTSLDGSAYGNCNDISLTSSYGTSWDGENVLPDVLAPGTYVIAAYNGNLPSIRKYYTHSEVYEDKTYYWGQISGTSMSSPMVAGVIALWLEANPTLTWQQIKETIRVSSNPDALVAKYPERSAYGVIDAYKGLKYVLTTLSTPTQEYEAFDKLTIRFLSSRSIEGVIPYPVSSATVHLTDMAGRELLRKSIDTQVFDLDLPDTSGCYMLYITTPKGRLSQKLFLR